MVGRGTVGFDSGGGGHGKRARVAPAVTRGAIIYSDDSHVRRGWLWHDSMTNSSNQVASAASFDLVASGSSSVDKLSDPCLCHR
jgi:hypothetical protein